METNPPPKESKPRSLAEIDLPSGDGPKDHAPRFVDPRVVEAHFAPLMSHPPSAAERWAKKANASPFDGL